MTPAEDWYAGWVRNHVTATGADAAAARALLSDVVRTVLVTNGKATPGELGEVTVRLIARRDTPKFANEHSDAVGAELVRLRAERRLAAAGPPVATNGDFAPDCPACGGSGLAVVPVRACVWERRLVLHPQLKRIVTGAVLCDRCPAGEAAITKERHRTDKKDRRPTLTQVARVLGCDPVALLRAFEREQAEYARRELAGSRDGEAWSRLVASLVAKAQGGHAA